MEANPKNADILFSSANRFMRSDDGGINWKIKSTPHGDNHDIWIHPSDTSLWVQSNDGGANVTTNSVKLSQRSIINLLLNYIKSK